MKLFKMAATALGLVLCQASYADAALPKYYSSSNATQTIVSSTEVQYDIDGGKFESVIDHPQHVANVVSTEDALKYFDDHNLNMVAIVSGTDDAQHVGTPFIAKTHAVKSGKVSLTSDADKVEALKSYSQPTDLVLLGYDKGTKSTNYNVLGSNLTFAKAGNALEIRVVDATARRVTLNDTGDSAKLDTPMGPINTFANLWDAGSKTGFDKNPPNSLIIFSQDGHNTNIPVEITGAKVDGTDLVFTANILPVKDAQNKMLTADTVVESYGDTQKSRVDVFIDDFSPSDNQWP
jgi:hypothetical protein